MPGIISIVDGYIESILPDRADRLWLNGIEYPLPRGAVVLPGLTDAHCHLIGLGLMADRVDLRGARSPRECAERMAARAARLPAGVWVEGFGWNQEEWGDLRMPDRSFLDPLLPDRPAVLQRIDSHASWVNGAALSAAGIVPHEVPGGEIALDANGLPTGILIDNAMKLVERAVPPASVERRAGWIEYGARECLRFGITEVHDMNVEPERLEPMAIASERGGLGGLRCNVFLAAQGEEWRSFGPPARLTPDIDVVGVKYFMDGALGSRGAFLLEPYADAPETCGIRLLTSEELHDLALEPMSLGFAVATHAIGDAANRLALDACARLRPRDREAILRIEHAQIVHPSDRRRFAELGVLPSMQPTHCTSDARMAERRLGAERCGHAYSWRSLRELGLPIPAGSDFPIESPDPLAGLRAFSFREPEPGGPAWYGEERISQQEAIDAYTTWPTLGIPGGPRRGRLEEGYEADLTVLSADPFVEPEARVLATIVAGTIRYEAE